MLMPPHHLEFRMSPDGMPSVEVVFDLTAVQVAAGAHAVRVIRDARHRTQEMSSAVDVLTRRELTSLVDELAALEAHASAVTLRASAARLGVLRGALEEFSAAEHVEREGDAAARPVVYGLTDLAGDLHGEAIRAALAGPPVAH
jgi:hypothetical protein